jgi:nucleoside 2-deoxyribosyltransferase
MRPRHSVYCVRPMTGWSLAEIKKYYIKLAQRLHGMGYRVYHPLLCREEVDSSRIITPRGSTKLPHITDRAIFSRDKWMVREADIVYANFIGAEKASIGSCFEIAWAHILGKHVIIVMDKNNPHRHTFMLEAADVIFMDEKSALRYMSNWGTASN